MTTEPKKLLNSIDELRADQAALHKLLALAKEKQEIPRDLNLEVFTLSAELVDTTIDQVEMLMELNQDLTQACLKIIKESSEALEMSGAAIFCSTSFHGNS